MCLGSVRPLGVPPKNAATTAQITCRMSRGEPATPAYVVWALRSVGVNLAVAHTWRLPTVRVYFLRLERARNLQWAFNAIAEAADVTSSTFEIQLCEVQFVAPRRQADALVERIYLDGGLVWCSRHDFKLTQGFGVR